MSAIVLSPNKYNYRRVAQLHYNLSDEELAEVDIHHNPPRHLGGRNIPEHLYIYHPTTHAAIHGGYTEYARRGAKAAWEARVAKGMGKGYRTGGGAPKKTKLRAIEIEIGKLASMGMKRKEIMEKLNLTEHQVKRAVAECRKAGLVINTKPGPKKGSPQRGGVPKGTKQPNQYTRRV